MNPAIELFRGIAAWMVLTSHYAYLFTSERTILNFLWTGVDFFFVISGFVFAKNIYNGNFALIPYFIRRFCRIYPLYFFSLLLYYLVVADTPDKIIIFIKHLFFLQTTSSIPETFFFNAAYWSLPVEVEFYLCLPLLAILTAKYKQFILLLLIFFLFIKLGLAYYSTPILQPNNYTILAFHLPGLLIEFLVGTLLYKIYQYYQKVELNKYSHILLIMTSLLLLYGLSHFFVENGDVGIEQHILFKAYFNFFCAIAYAILLFPFFFLIKIQQTKIVKLCMIMGNLSYGVYLFHNLIPHLFAQIGYTLTGGFAYFVYLMIVIIMSLLLFYTLEEPFRRLGKNWSRYLVK